MVELYHLVISQTDPSCGAGKPAGGARRWPCSGSDRRLPAVFRRHTALWVFLCQLLPLYELSALQYR